GAPLLGVGVDQDVAAAGIDDDGVARLYMAEDTPHARDGRDAATAGDDGGVAGLAARLGDDAADFQPAEGDDLGGEQLVGHDDDRATEDVRPFGFDDVGEVGGEADDDVPHVVDPLLDVLVVRLGEENGVFVEQAVQSGLGGEAVVDDPGADFVGEGGVPQDGLVGGEDGSFGGADLGRDL